MIDLGNRILLNDGASVVSDDQVVQILLDTGELPEHIKVIESDEFKVILIGVIFDTKTRSSR